MPLSTLPLSILDDTPARRVRARRDDDTVEDYRRARLDQRADPTLRPFPPLRVLLDPNGTHWLWDGGHRRAALLAAGDTEYPCEVEPGDLGEAIRRARKDANTDNGLRRSIEDKQAIAREICAEELDRQDRGEAPTPSRDLGALAGGTRERPALSHTFINKMLKQLREEREQAAAHRAEDEAALHAIETLAPRALAAGFPRLRAGYLGAEVDLGAVNVEALGRNERLGLADRLRALVARDPRRDPRPHDVLRLPGGSIAILLAGSTTWAPSVRLLQVGGTEAHHRLTADEYRPLVAGAEVIQTARPIPDPLDSTRDPRWLPPLDGHDWLGTDAATPPPTDLLPAGRISLESPCPASSPPVASTATPPPAQPAATGTATGELTLAQLRDRTERALNRLIKAGRTFTLRADWPTGGGEQDPAIWLDELDDTAEGELREALPVIEAASTSATPAPAQPLAVRRQEVVEQPIAADNLFPDWKALEDTVEKVARERDELRALWTAEQQEHRQTARECGDARQEHDTARADLAKAIKRASTHKAELLDELTTLHREHRAAHALIARVLDLREGRIPDGWPESWPESAFPSTHNIAERRHPERGFLIAQERGTGGKCWGVELETYDCDTRDEAERTARLWAWTLDLLEAPCTPPAPPSPSPCSSASPTSEPPPSVESADAPHPSPSTSDAAPAAVDPSASTAPSCATAVIPSDPPGLPPWVARIRSRLGTVPDHEIAREVGSTPSQVGKVRRQLKIPACTGKPGNVADAEPWRALLNWTGDADGLTVAIEALDEAGFVDLYTHLTGVAPKKRTAKTIEAAVKSILRRWSVEASNA